jgi:hypothetical protein
MIILVKGKAEMCRRRIVQISITGKVKMSVVTYTVGNALLFHELVLAGRRTIIVATAYISIPECKEAYGIAKIKCDEQLHFDLTLCKSDTPLTPNYAKCMNACLATGENVLICALKCGH